MQLLAAVNRALHDERSGAMRTKHLHSEIVYALAATQNVSFKSDIYLLSVIDWRGVQIFWA